MIHVIVWSEFNIKWFHKQHQWNTNNSNERHCSIDMLVRLLIPNKRFPHNFALLQKYIDHKRNHWWRLSSVLPLGQPLHNNQETHVPKERHHHHELRQKLKHKLDGLVVIKRVRCLHANSNAHLNNSSNYCKFHFEWVYECKWVWSFKPFIIKSKRVNTFWLQNYSSWRQE